MGKGTKDTPPTCDACGKPAARAAYHNGWEPLHEIQLAPKLSVRVCTGRRGPSDVCARRAIEKLSKCPGCGTEHARPGRICTDCRARLDRQAQTDDGPLAWAIIEPAGAFGKYLGDREGGLELDELGELLCQLGAARGPRRWGKGLPPRPPYDETVLGTRQAHTGCVYVELDELQMKALEVLLAKLSYAGRLQWRDGFAKGENLLRRLAGQDCTPAQHEQWRQEYLAVPAPPVLEEEEENA